MNDSRHLGLPEALAYSQFDGIAHPEFQNGRCPLLGGV